MRAHTRTHRQNRNSVTLRVGGVDPLALPCSMRVSHLAQRDGNPRSLPSVPRLPPLAPCLHRRETAGLAPAVSKTTQVGEGRAIGLL